MPHVDNQPSVEEFTDAVLVRSEGIKQIYASCREQAEAFNTIAARLDVQMLRAVPIDTKLKFRAMRDLLAAIMVLFHDPEQVVRLASLGLERTDDDRAD